MNDFETQGEIAEGLELVFNLIARYEILERMFFSKQSGVQKELSGSIVKLYAAILLYLSEAHRYYGRSTPGKIAFRIRRPAKSTVQDFDDKIKSTEAEVDHYIQLATHEALQTTGHAV